jgi:CheY-like chemotaxis protein
MMTMNDTNTILLVDDNETDNLITKRVIELSGRAGKIMVRNSGRSALDFLLENLTNAEALPDIIFLDINMPMVDGFSFLNEMDQFSPLLPKDINIVILSSSDSSNDIERALMHPRVLRFITKPLASRELTEVWAQCA